MRYGRSKIQTNIELREDTIAQVLQDALNLHRANAMQIRRLEDMYSGYICEVAERIKTFRPEIKTIASPNYANLIANTHLQYFLQEPPLFVGRDGQEEVAELNQLMNLIKKPRTDRDVYLDALIGGVGYVFIHRDMTGAYPFRYTRVSPYDAFLLYSTDIAYGDEPIAGVIISNDAIRPMKAEAERDAGFMNALGFSEYTVYTRTNVYKVNGFGVTDLGVNVYNGIPLVELALDRRIGVFEVVDELLVALGLQLSNAIDGSVQNVDGILKAMNVEFPDDVREDLNKKKRPIIEFRSTNDNKADVSYLETPIHQMDEHVLRSDIEDAVFQISQTPSIRFTGGSSGNNGAASLSQGWFMLTAKSLSFESVWDDYEISCLRIALPLARGYGSIGQIGVEELEVKYRRRNYENLTEQVNALVMMLGGDYRIAPEIAIPASGLFTDPAQAIRVCDEYNEALRSVGNAADGVGPDKRIAEGRRTDGMGDDAKAFDSRREAR